MYKKVGKTVLYIPMEVLQFSPEKASSDKKLVQRMESKPEDFCMFGQWCCLSFSICLCGVCIKGHTHRLLVYSKIVSRFHFLRQPFTCISPTLLFFLILLLLHQSFFFVLFPTNPFSTQTHAFYSCFSHHFVHCFLLLPPSFCFSLILTLFLSCHVFSYVSLRFLPLIVLPFCSCCHQLD